MDAPEAIAERVRHLEMKVNKLANPASLYKSTLFEDREVARRLAHLDLITHGWDDLQYQMVGQKLESPSSHITASAAEGAIVFAKTCDYPDDYVTMTIQMSHRWRIGTAIYPHLHWWQTAAAMPHLMIGYRWQINGELKETTWTNIAHSANAFTWSTGTLNQLTKFDHIDPPEGAGLSDCVQFRIYRDVADDSDLWNVEEEAVPEDDGTTQDDVYAVSFDIHFEIDAAGSYGEYTK